MSSAAAAFADEGAIAAADDMHAARGCCCFWIEWPAVRGRGAWQRIRSAEGGCPAASRRWWARGLKALLKVRRWSQTVAVSRWRSFIRRLRKRRGGNRTRGARFGYDPLSYARNFDEGQASDDSDGDTARRGFSARYATPSRKASMDLSAAPPFVGDDYRRRRGTGMNEMSPFPRFHRPQFLV